MCRLDARGNEKTPRQFKMQAMQQWVAIVTIVVFVIPYNAWPNNPEFLKVKQPRVHKEDHGWKWLFPEISHKMYVVFW